MLWLASATHLVGFEGIGVLFGTLLRILIVPRAILAFFISCTSIRISAVWIVPLCEYLIVHVPIAFALGRTATVFQWIFTTPVALWVTLFGIQTVPCHVLKAQMSNTASTNFFSVWLWDCRWAPEQFFFRQIDLLVARLFTLCFCCIDRLCISDWICDCKAPAWAAASLVHYRRETTFLLLPQVLKLRKTWKVCLVLNFYIRF